MVKICTKQLVMSVWGWWAFDIFTLMASYLGADVIGAQTIMRTLGLISFMIPVGFASACFVFVGASVGEKKPKRAMQNYRICMVCGIVITLLQITVLYQAQDAIMGSFTPQAAIKEQLKLAWPIFLVFTIFDTTQAVSGAVVRACGKQLIGAFVTAASYFACGIPVSYYQTFQKDHGIIGLWMGPTLSVLLMTCLYNLLICNINWQSLFDEADAR